MQTMVLTFLFLLTSIQQTEKYPFSKWTKEIQEEANTAKNAVYMSEEERNVIFLCNLARLDGKLFAETYVAKYYDDKEVVKNSYATTLVSDLKRSKKMSVLYPNENLFRCAKDHAISNGNKGLVGHQNYSKRFKQHAPEQGFTGENCDYGFNNALDIVMRLLIDQDVPDKGHRKNILEKGYLVVGVSIQPHKKWDYNAVMCFGDKR